MDKKVTEMKKRMYEDRVMFQWNEDDLKRDRQRLVDQVVGLQRKINNMYQQLEEVSDKLADKEQALADADEARVKSRDLKREKQELADRVVVHQRKEEEYRKKLDELSVYPVLLTQVERQLLMAKLKAVGCVAVLEQYVGPDSVAKDVTLSRRSYDEILFWLRQIAAYEYEEIEDEAAADAEAAAHQDQPGQDQGGEARHARRRTGAERSESQKD